MFSWLSGALRRGSSDSAAREQPAADAKPAPTPAKQAAPGRLGPGSGQQQEASGIARPAQPQLGSALHAADSQATGSKVGLVHSSATAAGSGGGGSTAQAAKLNGGRGRGRPKGSSPASLLASSPGRGVGSKRLASEVSALAAPAVGGKRVRKPPALLMHEPPGPQLGTPTVRLPKPSTIRVPVTAAADSAQPAPKEAKISRDAALQSTASPKAPLPEASNHAGAASGKKTRGSTAAKAAGSQGRVISRKRLASQEQQQQQPRPQQQQHEHEQEQEQLEGAMPMASAMVSVPAAGSTACTGAQEQLQVLQPPLGLVLPLTLLPPPPRPKRQRQPPNRLMNQSEGRQLASAEDRAAEAARRRAARPSGRHGGESVSTAPSGPPAAAAAAGMAARPTAAPDAAASLQGGASPVASSSSEADTPSLVLVNKAPASPERPEHGAAGAESRLRPLSAAPEAPPPASQPHAMAAPHPPAARPPELPQQALAACMQQSSDHLLDESVGPTASDGLGSSWLQLPLPASAGPMTAATAAQEIDPILSRAAALLPAGGWQTVPVTTNPFISTVRAFLEDPCIPDPSEHLMQPSLPLPGAAAAGQIAGLPLTVSMAPGGTKQPDGAARGRPWDGRRRNWRREVPIWMEEAIRMGLHGPISSTAASGQAAAAQPARAPVAWFAPHQRAAMEAAAAGAQAGRQPGGIAGPSGTVGAADAAQGLQLRLEPEEQQRPKPILPVAPIGPFIILQQLQPTLAATEAARASGVLPQRLPVTDPSQGMTAVEAARAAAKLPKPPPPPEKPKRSPVDPGIDNDPGVHPALQPRRRRGRPRTKGLPDLQPGQVMTLDEALRVPPPPGVRPWNWRRQQTRAVMRQQALAEAAEGRGQGGEKVPTTAAEALLLAAERQGSGSPEAPTPEAARAAGMGMPTPGGGRISLVTARSLADATAAKTAAPAVVNGAADSDDSGLTGGALANGGGDDNDADSSRPQLVALLNGADIGPSSSPGRQTRNRSYPARAEEPMDESEAEMLLGLKPKPGTLVPVKSGRVDDRGVWAPDWRRGQTRRIIIDRAGTKHYYVVAGS